MQANLPGTCNYRIDPMWLIQEEMEDPFVDPSSLRNYQPFMSPGRLCCTPSKKWGGTHATFCLTADRFAC